MYGKKVKLRFLFLSLIFIVLILTIYLVLKSLEKNVIYFISPTEIKEIGEINYKKKYRIGGMVKENSILMNTEEVSFIITDYRNEIIVKYSGVIPNLFSEKKGVVAEGFLKDRNILEASKILAKHDENYMPPQIKKILKENVK